MPDPIILFHADKIIMAVNDPSIPDEEKPEEVVKQISLCVSALINRILGFDG